MAPVRYRCAACGNLTRFDVTSTRRTRGYHHYSLSGELSVEEPEVLHEIVEEVSCRWCASGRAVEELTPGLPSPEGSQGVLAQPDLPAPELYGQAEPGRSGD